MTSKLSKTNEDLAYFNRRLDEIHMNGYERLKAKAHLARAEAIAEFLAAGVSAIARLFKGSPSQPNRPATSAG